MRIENTFGIEAKARVLFSYDSEQALQSVLDTIGKQYADLPILLIGEGSNMLFLRDYNGVVLKSDIKGISVRETAGDDIFVEVGSGERCDAFIAEAIRRGWYGMENLSLIPGQIGAAAVQNIGAYGVEAKDVIAEVRGISLADGTVRTWGRDECGYGYRRSVFKEELWCKYAITRVTFRLSRKFVPHLQYGGLSGAVRQAGFDEKSLTAGQLRNIIIDIRRSKLPDPDVQGNAGSFFKNPIVPKEKAEQLLSVYPQMPHYPAEEGKVKLAAGWLIEQTGWKGKSVGPAAVHDRQALVLVNKGGATGSDIQRLSDAIRRDVGERFGIELEQEVNFIG